MHFVHIADIIDIIDIVIVDIVIIVIIAIIIIIVNVLQTGGIISFLVLFLRLVLLNRIFLHHRNNRRFGVSDFLPVNSIEKFMRFHFLSSISPQPRARIRI